jgi:hypothetical protein
MRHKFEMEVRVVASESAIIAEIENIVTNYLVWTIGVTEHPGRRKIELGNPHQWHQWNADTETAARNVEKYFLTMGAKGGSVDSDRAHYVYIF